MLRLLVLPVTLPLGFLSFVSTLPLASIPLKLLSGGVETGKTLIRDFSAIYRKFYRAKFMFCEVGLSRLCGSIQSRVGLVTICWCPGEILRFFKVFKST